MFKLTLINKVCASLMTQTLKPLLLFEFSAPGIQVICLPLTLITSSLPLIFLDPDHEVVHGFSLKFICKMTLLSKAPGLANVRYLLQFIFYRVAFIPCRKATEGI